MRYNHIGIPTRERFAGEIDLPHLAITVSDHQNNPFGIQWQRYWDDAPYRELVKTVPHVAFEVDDLATALDGQRVIIEPNSPSRGVLAAFIEVNGAPVELLQIDREARPDLRAGGPRGGGAPGPDRLAQTRVSGIESRALPRSNRRTPP